MECPLCHRSAIQAAEAGLDGEASWWICPDQSCLQDPWRDTGRAGRPGEPAPMVDRLVGLDAETLERAADPRMR
jgi:hypothetical protein